MPTITIDITAEVAARIAKGYQHNLGLDAPATLAQVKAELVKQIKAVVREAETLEAQQAVVVPPDVEAV